MSVSELRDYLERLQLYIDASFSAIGFPEESLVLSIVKGDTYAKIEARLGGIGKVFPRRTFDRYHNKMTYDYWTWGFIDLRNGDCLRADSYKTPSTKTPRGNIRDRYEGLGQVNLFGYSAVNLGEGIPKGLRLSA